MSQQGADTPAQLPSLFRPYSQWILAQIEEALRQRGIGSRYVVGTVIRGISDVIARVGVRLNTGGSTYNRRRINLIEGANVTITVADDAADEEVDVTIAAGALGIDSTLIAPVDGGFEIVFTPDGEIITTP